jgi:hypothetical protein
MSATTGTVRRAVAGLALLVAISFGLLLLPGIAPAPPVRVVASQGNYPALSAAIHGPATVGYGLTQNYTITATGGPAQAINGTVVGSYTYKRFFTATDTTGVSWGQSEGVLNNGSTTLPLRAPGSTETLTLAALITSTYRGSNATINVTLAVNVVQPYVVSTTLLVGSGGSVQAFYLTVALDSVAVGNVRVPTLTAGTSYPLNFSYVNPSLAPGWHTFSISLVAEHGLVTFPGGTQSYTSTFYVTPPSTDYTLWYLTGATAFLGAIVIRSMGVGARRRAKPKK